MKKEYLAEPSNLSNLLFRIHSVQIDGGCDDIIIRLAPGIYRGPFLIQRPNLTLIGTGDSPADTVLTGDLAANVILEDGLRRGTFRTQTVLVDASHCTFENLTFANTAGPGEIANQALALYSDGDDLHFINCRLLGHQDTLFTGPLPPNELQPGGFRGPKEHAPRISGRQTYTNCYIEGTVDFIFGSAVAYFENCEIHSIHRPEDAEGYVTAASTPEGQDYGYVFDHCRFTADPGTHDIYLGRPWRNFAHVAVLHCELGSHIHPAHWHDWGKKEAHSTIRFVEYDNVGPGAKASLPTFAKQLSEAEAGRYTKELVFQGKF